VAWCQPRPAPPRPAYKHTALVSANEEDIGILLKAILRAIAMVDIKVKNEHLQGAADVALPTTVSHLLVQCLEGLLVCYC
jgi:hypothetical protein